jgi:hypothetical protein
MLFTTQHSHKNEAHLQQRVLLYLQRDSSPLQTFLHFSKRERFQKILQYQHTSKVVVIDKIQDFSKAQRFEKNEALTSVGTVNASFHPVLK